MTGSFSHLLPLALVCVIVYITADIFNWKPIYESLLERFLNRNSCDKATECDITKAILEIAVYMGSMLDGKKIKEFEWPDHWLLVGVKRGGEEIIPKGNTLIYPGDYLIVLTDENRAAKVTESLLEMANSYK